jgi:hypothetical protein
MMVAVCSAVRVGTMGGGVVVGGGAPGRDGCAESSRGALRRTKKKRDMGCSMDVAVKTCGLG